MNLTINNVNHNKRQYKQTFTGPLDGALTGILRTLDTNAMANAAVLDVGFLDRISGRSGAAAGGLRAGDHRECAHRGDAESL